MNKITKAQRKITRAIRTLKVDQGRVARRNARSRVFAAMRSLEHAIDAEFPLEPKRLKADRSLKAASERMTVGGFDRELLKHTPLAWDTAEVQMFANWIFDKYQQPARPVVIGPYNANAKDIAEAIYIDETSPTATRFVRLWQYLAWWTIRAAISEGRKFTPRVRVRHLYEIAAAWGDPAWRELLEPRSDAGEMKLEMPG